MITMGGPRHHRAYDSGSSHSNAFKNIIAVYELSVTSGDICCDLGTEILYATLKVGFNE